jgi:outer membrane cobalamin receptor
MKKFLVIAGLISAFTVNVFAQADVFLSLTKTDEKIENLPTNVTVITQEEIANKHVETLGELLANEAGVFYGEYGLGVNASFISMRGAASSTRVLVLIDGRRVYTLDSGAANFASIPTTNIEKVEIIRGAGAAVYGTGAFGGVINIITKKASDTPLAQANVSYGSYNTYSANIAGAYTTEKFAGFLSGSTLWTDGYRKNSKYTGYNAFFSGQYNVNENNNFSLSGSYWQNKFGLPGDIYSQSLTAEDKNFSGYAKLDYNLILSEDDSLQISAYSSQDEYEDKGNRHSDYYYKNISNIYGFQADFHYKDILLAGAEFWQEKYTNKNFDMTYDPVTWLPGPPAYSKYDKTQENYAAYTQLNYAVGKLRVIPGIRGNHNSKYGDVFTPSIAAIYNINDNLKVSGNTGRVWRAPTFIDLYYPGYSNPDLKPEEGISSDFGIEYTKGNARVSATGYYITTDDLIVALQNVGKTRQYGVEVEAGYIFSSKIQNKINYTYLNAKNITDSNNEKVLKYSPEHSINYTVNVKPIDKLNFNATASYKSKYEGNHYDSSIFATVDTVMDGFFTLDLSASYKLNDRFSFWMKGFNITNADYQIIDGYPMPGITVYAGVNFKFWK